MISKRNLITFVLIFSVLVSLFLWDDLLHGNEAQTLANVFQFANNDWIPGDWFLSMDTVYRYPFNIVLYPLAKIFSITTLALVSRILLIAAIASGLTAVVAQIPLTSGSLLLFTIITFKMKGMLAGEDILWHVESKVLAYACVLWGLSFLLKKKYLAMWLFLGGAATFHPLVGGYSVISLLIYFIVAKKQNKLSMIKTAPLFALTGWPGLAVVLYNLLTKPETLSVATDLLYVARHPHHMNPEHFVRHVHKGFPEWMDLMIIVGNVIFCAIILLLAIKFTRKNSKERTLLLYAGGSLILWLVGLTFYLSGMTHLLKYYLFRFPDVIVPFTAYLLFFKAVDYFWFIKHPKILKIFSYGLGIILVLFFTYQTFGIIKQDVPLTHYYESVETLNVSQWIEQNTPASSQFIIDPGVDNFHFLTNRAQFVSLKHIPQNEKDVDLWYQKLVRLNKDKDFFIDERLLNINELRSNYYLLSDAELKSLHEDFGMNYYLGENEREGNLEQVYSNDKYGVYFIK